MSEKDNNSSSGSSNWNRDGAEQKKTDDAWASDMPAQDAAQDDAKVKGGIYKRFHEQTDT